MNNETQQKLYKIEAPIGTIMPPDNPINEAQLREFATQIMSDPNDEVWKEKIAKDDIVEIIAWLTGSQYKITEL